MTYTRYLTSYRVPSVTAIVITGLVQLIPLMAYASPHRVLYANVLNSNIDITMSTLAYVITAMKAYFAESARRRALQSEFGQMILESGRQQEERSEERSRQQEERIIRHMDALADPGASYRRMLLQEATHSVDD